MANTAVGKMTLVSGLLIMAPWFFTSIKLATAKISSPLDIALVLMPDKDVHRDIFRYMVLDITGHYEFGEDKAKMALVTGYVEKGKENWLMHPLSADTGSLENTLEHWGPPRYSNPVFDYGAAFRALSTVFANSSDRAKAVIMIIMAPPTSDDVKEMVKTSKQLRDDGGNIYIIVHINDTLGRWVAENITAGTERVILDDDPTFPFPYYGGGLILDVFPLLDEDLASRTTTPPTPAPTQKPPGSTPSPYPAGKSTTTSRGVVAKPTPPLQWASRLLIGLGVTPFRFISGDCTSIRYNCFTLLAVLLN